MWSIFGFWLMRVDSGFWLMWSNSGVSDHTTLHYSPPPPPRPPITSPCPLLINTTATASLIQTTPPHAVLFSFDQLNFFDLDTRSCSLLMKWGSKQSLYPLHRRSQKGYHRNLFKKLKVSSIKHRKTKCSFLISLKFKHLTVGWNSKVHHHYYFGDACSKSLVDWKKCPQSLVCFWQIRMRRMRAWNNNEVEKLSRLRHFFGKIQTDKHVQYGEIFIGLEVTNFEIVGRMLMCALVKIECRTLRRACIWRLESEGCCEVSTAGLTPSCETCGSQSHRLACLATLEEYFWDTLPFYEIRFYVSGTRIELRVNFV